MMSAINGYGIKYYDGLCRLYITHIFQPLFRHTHHIFKQSNSFFLKNIKVNFDSYKTKLCMLHTFGQLSLYTKRYIILQHYKKMIEFMETYVNCEYIKELGWQRLMTPIIPRIMHFHINHMIYDLKHIHNMNGSMPHLSLLEFSCTLDHLWLFGERSIQCYTWQFIVWFTSHVYLMLTSTCILSKNYFFVC